MRFKLIGIYFLAGVLSLLGWNLIIGNFIYQETPDVLDYQIGNRKEPFSRRVNGQEGYASIITDAMGFNNKFISPAKQMGVFRIIVLGDSIAEALQVKQEENFSGQLNHLLNQTDKKFEVFNLAVSGRAVPDYISYAPGYLEIFKPELVIMQINTADFTADARNAGNQNYLLQTADGLSIKNDTRLKTSGFDKLRELKNKLGAFKPIVEYAKKHFIDLRKKNRTNEVKADLAFAPGAATDDLAAIDWQMNKLKEAYDDKLIIFYANPAPVLKNGRIFLTEDDDQEQTKKMIMAATAKYQIDFVDPYEEFIDQYRTTGQLPRGFNNSEPGAGHFNAAGHSAVAAALFEYLQIKLAL
ncbi:MAG: GDSL-type esterase/lipase family protein [Candidatus Komeilibacteria bacterium]|nr:GDSL-type esterase/lipase family protein [Candidatus Komeilibacteria bacterium]